MPTPLNPAELAKGRPTKTLHVDEWNGEITIRRLTITEYAELADRYPALQGATGNLPAQLPLFVELLSIATVDPAASVGQWKQCYDNLAVDSLISLGLEALEFCNAKKNSSPTNGAETRSRSVKSSGSRTRKCSTPDK